MTKPKGAKCAKSAHVHKRRKITTQSGKTYHIWGATSSRGDKWVRIKTGPEVAYVPYAMFAGSGKQAAQHMAVAGLVIIGPKNWTAIRDEVAKLRQFPPEPLLERSGWSDGHFAFPDGSVSSPPDAARPVVLFHKDPFKCAQAGTLRGWKAGVAEPLARQTIACFMLMTMFAPPLLELTNRVGNFGFELVSERGKGKSTMLQLMSSVAGGALPSAPGHYWMTCNTTANALESAMRVHSDLPMLLDEAADYAASGEGRARGAAFRELVFHLAAGTTKARWNGPQQTEHRFVYVMTTNKALAEVLSGGNAAVNSAAGDRLITLPISDDRSYGTFDSLPAEHSDAGSFAEALKRAAAENYGLALPKFIGRLVADRAEDEPALRRRIEKDLHKFRQRVGADPNDGSELRVVDAFGLSYAAARLANDYKVLPKNMRCLAAAVACYNLHRTAVRALADLPERLLQLARRDGVIELNKGIPKLTDSQLKKVPAFLWTTRSGRREILFKQAMRDRFFPDFREREPEALALGLFKADKGRDTVRRAVRRGGKRKKEEVYRFFLPDDDE